jgi:hypothetical protein
VRLCTDNLYFALYKSLPIMDIEKVKDYEKRCKDKLDPQVFDYFFSGSDEEITLKNNTNAYNMIKICPRVLKDISKI